MDLPPSTSISLSISTAVDYALSTSISIFKPPPRDENGHKRVFFVHFRRGGGPLKIVIDVDITVDNEPSAVDNDYRRQNDHLCSATPPQLTPSARQPPQPDPLCTAAEHWPKHFSAAKCGVAGKIEPKIALKNCCNFRCWSV